MDCALACLSFSQPGVFVSGGLALWVGAWLGRLMEGQSGWKPRDDAMRAWSGLPGCVGDGREKPNADREANS